MFSYISFDKEKKLQTLHMPVNLRNHVLLVQEGLRKAEDNELDRN